MTDQVGISKMETVDVEKERERFEYWFSDNGANKKAIERRGEGYLLMQAQSAWGVWLAAKKQAMEELEPLDTIYQWRSKPRNQPKRVFTGPWHNCSHVGYVALRENNHPRLEYETRTLYAKKGE